MGLQGVGTGSGKFHKISAGLCFPSLTSTEPESQVSHWEEQTPATGCLVKVTVTQPVSDMQESQVTEADKRDSQTQLLKQMKESDNLSNKQIQ